MSILYKPWFRALASVRVAIVLALATSALLGVASLLLPSPRGKDALPFSESFTTFLEPVSPEYWWFYLLFVLFTGFTINAIVGTLRSWLVHKQRGARFVGVTLMHLGFIGALFSHLAAGLTAGVEQGALVGSEEVVVGGHPMRLTSWNPVQNPDGTMRTATADVVVDGEPTTIAFNQPIFFDGTRRFLLLVAESVTGGPPVFDVAGVQTEVKIGEDLTTPSRTYEVLQVSNHPSLRAPAVLLRSKEPDGTERWFVAGKAIDSQTGFLGQRPEPAISVVLRRNDGIPILLSSMAVFSLGILLFLWGRRRP